jgi:regulator of sirC expression with transglutaminase-like and TPR domain
MIDPRTALDALGELPDGEIDIAAAALHFARIDAPDADPAETAAHLSDIARAAAAATAATPEAQAEALRDIMAVRFGYRGDTQTYDSADNANIIRVVKRRRGLPVALGILWIHAARIAGWAAAGINFPGHFLIAVGTKRRVVLDIFAGGTILNADALRDLLTGFEGEGARLRPAVLAPVSDRDVLLRLQNNIKLRRLRGGDLAGSRTCNLDMLRIAPTAAALWRDEALLADKCEEPAAAVAAWQKFLALTPDGGDAELAREALRTLRSRLN